MKRLVATSNSHRYARGRRIAVLIIVPILVAVAGLGMMSHSALCQEHPPHPLHTHRGYWIGKNINEAEKEFGTPTFSEQLIETGGMLVIYASRKDPVHFVFETDPSGRIVKAAHVE